MTVKRRNSTGCKSKNKKSLKVGFGWFLLQGCWWEGLPQQGHCWCRFMDLILWRTRPSLLSMSSMSTCLALISKLNSRVCQGLSVQILQKFGRRLSVGGERLDPYVASRRAQAFELSLCEEQSSRRREGTPVSFFRSSQRTESLITGSLKVVEEGYYCYFHPQLLLAFHA